MEKSLYKVRLGQSMGLATARMLGFDLTGAWTPVLPISSAQCAQSACRRTVKSFLTATTQRPHRHKRTASQESCQMALWTPLSDLLASWGAIPRPHSAFSLTDES